MFPLAVEEVARLCGGLLKGVPAAPVQRLVIDSRQVAPGDLFLALRGARSDGHDHLEEAARRGAVAALIEADGRARPATPCTILVPSTLAALATLARVARARLQAPVIGITGSVGKTTAKDFLATLLGGKEAKVHAAPASYNSEIGLPLAVLAAPADTRLLVLEYGINAPGEMDALLAIVAPQHAWITAIGAAHLEGLGSLEGVAEEKARLAQAVNEKGSVWLDPATAEVLSDARESWDASVHVVDFGTELLTGLQGRPGAWCLEHQRFGPLQLSLAARHQVRSALMAAQLATFLGADASAVAARLPLLKAPVGRMSLHHFGDLLVLEDCYNANPASMAAALHCLREAAPPTQPRWAILGTMHELGAAAEEAHQEVGRVAATLGLEAVVGIGEGGAAIAAGYRAAAGHGQVHAVADCAAAAELLQAAMPATATVLLKASRAARLECLCPTLEAIGQSAPAALPGGAA